MEYDFPWEVRLKSWITQDYLVLLAQRYWTVVQIKRIVKNRTQEHGVWSESPWLSRLHNPSDPWSWTLMFASTQRWMLVWKTHHRSGNIPRSPDSFIKYNRSRNTRIATHDDFESTICEERTRDSTLMDFADFTRWHFAAVWGRMAWCSAICFHV